MAYLSPKAYKALHAKLDSMPSIQKGRRKLLLIFGLLGDFDSFEHAQAIRAKLSALKKAEIELIIIGIGSDDSRKRFASYVDIPVENIFVDDDNMFHQEMNLSKGINLSKWNWIGLLLMCAGVKSPGTLSEVFRGYLGDRNSSQIYQDNQIVKTGFLPQFKGELFKYAGGIGFQRPFEKATLRLANMHEILFNWAVYITKPKYLTQRGGTFLLDRDNKILYSFSPISLLCYSNDMSEPMKWLNPWLNSNVS